MFIRAFIAGILILSSAYSFAQVSDSSMVLNPKDSSIRKLDKKKIYSSSRKATILSAILPGAGQVYNKKYWKLPIIYAGLGGFGYMFAFYNGQYNVARKYLKAEYDGDSTTVNNTGLSGDQLLVYKTKYRKFRDISVIGLAAVYVLNIIDANVDAHLKTFDVSDDLSLQIKPWEEVYSFSNGNTNFAAGISIKLKFK